MAHSTLIMENPNTGEMIRAPVGWSWTSLFFGVIVPFIRQDWIGGFVSLVLTLFVAGAVNIAMAFMYNRYYIGAKVKEGFVVTGAESTYSYAELERKVGIRFRISDTTVAGATTTTTTTTTTTVA